MKATESENRIGQETGTAPAALERLVQSAEAAGASDIHLQMCGKSATVGFRLDGVLAPFTTLDEGLAERVVGRIKYLAKLQTWQETLPQDGRIDRQSIGAKHDLRVATYPTVTGEKIVLRLFTTGGIKALAELGFDEATRSTLEQFLRRPAGMLLLTGPAGSGKTTTIYACLQELAGSGRHIITVEDPVEQILPGVMQTEICDARGLTFAKAARHLLRQDPQVLVIGEIRDGETADIAVRSALTGHLVISTLHAGSCRGVLERLLVMCRDYSAVAAAADLVLNQRLLRCLCAKCRGEGCEACLKTGYRDRRPLAEWLQADEKLRDCLRQGEAQTASPQTTLEKAARQLIAAGVTDDAEVKRVLGV